MQKTYDECYLVCSTAIYFEGQVSLSVTEEKGVTPRKSITDLFHVPEQRS